MNEPKPLASLSGSLLARKGAARPAMRPQVQRLNIDELEAPAHLEDLGWDDMGEQPDVPARTAEVLPLTPNPVTPEAKEEAEAEDRAAAAQLAEHARLMSTGQVPEVVRQQDMLAEKIAAVPEPEAERPSPPKPRVATPARQQFAASATATRKQAKRAAFTLRLDEDRHLKLRLASTIHGRSAQQLVTQALDRLFDEMPELELLAAQVKRRGSDVTN